MTTAFKSQYQQKTVKELRVIAKSSNIKGYYKLKKDDLITKIIEVQKEESIDLLKEPGILDIIYEYAGGVGDFHFDSNNIKTITQELIEKFGDENITLVNQRFPDGDDQCYLESAFAKNEEQKEYVDNNYSGNNLRNSQWINDDYFANINRFRRMTFFIRFNIIKSYRWKKKVEYFFNNIKSINGCKIYNIEFFLNSWYNNKSIKVTLDFE